jgi:ATP-dependent DNA helicase RecQ
MDEKYLHISKDVYSLRKKEMIKKTEAIIHFINSTKECRSAIILKYFGETNPLDCGMCDICIENKDDSERIKKLQKLILIELEKTDCTIESLGLTLGSNKKMLLKATQLLIDEKKIKLNDKNLFEKI